jgi:hypothetical protein
MPFDFESLMAEYLLYRKCQCGGTLNYKYRHKIDKAKQIWVYPKRGFFKVYIGGVCKVNDKIINLSNHV